MEVAGLVIGVAGLAGLFSTCLEAMAKVQDYVDYRSDLFMLETQLRAVKVRFEKWGKCVGVAEGKSLVNHHPALSDEQISRSVRELLECINNICKVAWTLWGKKERIEQVNCLDKLVQHLHNLVPVDYSSGPIPVHSAGSSWVNTPSLVSGTISNSQEHGLVQLGSTETHNAKWHEETQHILKLIKNRLKKEVQTAIQKELQLWLLSPRHSSELYDNSIRQRLEGTCNWMFDRPAFQHWISSDFPTGAKLFWINGPAGFGKTILCAHIVNYVSSTLSSPTAYFFFSSESENRGDPYTAIRSWISQLVSCNDGAFDIVRQRWEHNPNTVATRTVILEILTEILQVISGSTFIVDGLDECTTSSNSSTTIQAFISEIRRIIRETRTRVLFVSRDEPEIRQSLAADLGNKVNVFKVTPADVQRDTAAYSKDVINKRLPNKSEDDRTSFAQTMTNRCEGQFLWIKMQGESVRKGLNKKQILRVFEEAPTKLDSLYDQNWMKIMQLQERDRLRAFRLLRCAVLALRPLTVASEHHIRNDMPSLH
ncbi:hypothetical protein N3K66_009099 [Trichothecium roseum]|uniref:Uncharacterized protein n=1 Tax=Trichothecium roseum TaxID=47278 RepID=A0ACC0UPK3_9HYPO|nr:hypothetical protein N3K66_009099 [Trichothecium roseum]